jgi:hypothetical protein
LANEAQGIDIRPLKLLAARLLPEDSILRLVIMHETDFIRSTDYVAELGTWLSILDGEATRIRQPPTDS